MKQIIIDTDIGCDCDDARGACRRLCARKTRCFSPFGCDALHLAHRRLQRHFPIAAYYGRQDLPIGIYLPDGFLDQRKTYCDYLQKSFPMRFASKEEIPDAVVVLRKALSQAKPGSVSQLDIGPTVNLAALLRSQPDDISSLTGRELIAHTMQPHFNGRMFFAETETATGKRF